MGVFGRQKNCKECQSQVFPFQLPEDAFLFPFSFGFPRIDSRWIELLPEGDSKRHQTDFTQARASALGLGTGDKQPNLRCDPSVPPLHGCYDTDTQS